MTSAILLGVQVIFFIGILSSFWKLFSKAKLPGWTALIPIYNVVQMTKIAERSKWHAFGVFIPLLNFYSIWVIYYGISTHFGKGKATALGLIFLPLVFFPMLAFGKSTYHSETVSLAKKKMPVPPPPPAALRRAA